MNAAYFIEFKRGDQLLRAIPELTGVGYAENAFRVAPKEAVAVARAAVSKRSVAGDPIHGQWVNDLAKRLLGRRGEFLQYKRARINTTLESIQDLVELASLLPEVDAAAHAKAMHAALSKALQGKVPTEAEKKWLKRFAERAGLQHAAKS
jgi:hypothetical protein